MQIRFNFSVPVNLCRTRLAADGITVYLRVFAAAVFHHAVEQFAHCRAGFSGNRRRDDLGTGLFQHIAVAVFNGLHQIWLHQPPAVDHRACRRNHLNGRHRNALSETDACQINVLHPILSDENAAGLAI